MRIGKYSEIHIGKSHYAGVENGEWGLTWNFRIHEDRPYKVKTAHKYLVFHIQLLLGGRRWYSLRGDIKLRKLTKEEIKEYYD